MQILPYLLYNTVIQVLGFGMRAAALFNQKAKNRIIGVKEQRDISFKEKTIWMHCASLGEFEQGRPLAEALKKKYPAYPLVISFFSASGYEQQKKNTIADAVLYLPLDTPRNADQFVNRINPALVLWVKYEYWMNHLFAIQKKGTPLLLISGIFRADQPFFKSYGKLWRMALNGFDHLFVQNESSISLLQKIVINEKMSMSGDTRYDRVMAIASQRKDIDYIEQFIGKRICIVAGSTWEPDEKLLAAWMSSSPNNCLIIAPHEVNETNSRRIENLFTHSQRYSLVKSSGVVTPKSNLLIIDSIGMLSSLYRYGHIAYVGGGFTAGIHNTLEAAVYGIPVVFGPHYQKFEEAKALIQCNAGQSCANKKEGLLLLHTLVNDENKRKQMGINAGIHVKNNAGACEKILHYIEEKRLLTN